MADLIETIAAEGGIDGPILGGDWGGIMTWPEFVAQISRVAMVNNGLLVEITRADGSTGVYNFAEATLADKFL